MKSRKNVKNKVCISKTYFSSTVKPTCLKQPLSKRPKIGFQDQLSLNAGRKYCRMLPLYIIFSYPSVLTYVLGAQKNVS